MLCIEFVDDELTLLLLLLFVFMNRSATESLLLLPVVGRSDEVELDNVVDTDGELFCVATVGVGNGGVWERTGE